MTDPRPPGGEPPPEKPSGKSRRRTHSSYSREVAVAICERLADGETLGAICEDPAMPARSTVYLWLADQEEFRLMRAAADMDQADVWADETLEIADDARNDWMERHGKNNAGWRENGESVNRSKLRIWTRMWLAARKNPKKYGNFTRTELTGKDGNPLSPPTFQISFEDGAPGAPSNDPSSSGDGAEPPADEGAPA